MVYLYGTQHPNIRIAGIFTIELAGIYFKKIAVNY